MGVVNPPFRIVDRFPDPPGSVKRAWELLQIVRRGDAEEIADAGVDLNNLARPWSPATCPSELRESVWNWCDGVVAWLNHEYAWRPQQLIPPCWPLHPHLANELPPLAFARFLAEDALGPEALEDWHRYTQPMFLDRMQSRLGESTCRTGKHQDWPADSRYAAYSSADATDERANMIYTDTHQAPQLHRQRA